MNYYMIIGFEDELEKIASKKDDEPNLNFFERHPKKILAAVAALGGLAAFLKKKPAHSFPTSAPKSAASAVKGSSHQALAHPKGERVGPGVFRRKKKV